MEIIFVNIIYYLEGEDTLHRFITRDINKYERPLFTRIVKYHVESVD